MDPHPAAPQPSPSSPSRSSTAPARPEPRTRADYRHFLDIPTRWMDNDVYGHVNNVVYYSYFDTVVNAYLIRAGVLDAERGETIGLVVETQCHYFAPLAFPQTVEAGLRVAKLGGSSVRYEIGLFAKGCAAPAAQGHFVHVYVGRESRRPVPLPEALRVSALAVTLLTGLSYGLLLFMLSAGLALSFSLLGVLNFAHASFYLLGAYLGVTLAAHAGVAAAFVLAPLAVGGLGAVLERVLLRRVRGQGHLGEMLLTFGLAYLAGESAKLAWGAAPLAAAVPAALDGPLFVYGGAAFTRYRAFVMAVSIAMLIGLAVLLRVSSAGRIVRAALTHRAAVEALGHDVSRVSTLVFAAGAALAALAGAIGAPLTVVEPGMANTIGPIVFAVIVIGGLGSLAGAFAASLLVGCAQTFAVASTASFGDLAALAGVHLPPGWAALTVAQCAPLVPFLLLVAVLSVRARGLFGERDDA